jgi:hypothetical protein
VACSATVLALTVGETELPYSPPSFTADGVSRHMR